MVGRKAKLRVRKSIKDTQASAQQAQESAAKHLERHVVRRWANLKEVRRFVVGWLVLMIVLASGVALQHASLGSHYMEMVPATGGSYIEGIIGEVKNLNPVFATSAPDTASARLVFSSLLKYDDGNLLVGDLATDWSLDEEEVVYTVELRQDAYWHDGEQVTADDVVFTYDSIQHPDTKSPLRDSWLGVTVQAKDDFTVTFSLPNPYTPFPHSMTNGIIPEHLLNSVNPDQLRAHEFNLEPIGSGPFKFEELFVEDETGQINMVQNEGYYAGMAKVDNFVIETFTDHEDMIDAFNEDELSAVAGLRTFDLPGLDEQDFATAIEFPLYNQVFIFLKNDDPVLKDANIRKALSYATDKQAIFRVLDMQYALGDSPLLNTQLGYDKSLTQPGYDLDKANQLLDEAGWERGKDGVRVKGDERLEIELISQRGEEFPLVTEEVQKQWLKAGVMVELVLVSENDLNQNFIATHNFQALAFGISQGADPDVFPYWHSSQARTSGFNLSDYKNGDADTALEAGRTRSDPEIRVAKYKSFLEEWLKDTPAIALYRPNFNYVIHSGVAGVEPCSIISPADRYKTVLSWSVLEQSERKPL